MRLLVHRTRTPLRHALRIPHSKYHAHRALILASLAKGTSEIAGLTHAKHVEFTVNVLRGLGATVSIMRDRVVISGGPYNPRRSVLSVGSSGSTLYFMVGLCSLADRPITLVGQNYFSRRPVRPLLDSLTQMGLRITSRDGCLPIRVDPVRPAGGQVRIAGTLSQWISGLILLAPFAQRETVIEVDGPLNEVPYIDLTVQMMRHFGLEIDVSGDRRRFVVPANQEPRPARLELPPDIGSAAFGLAIAALHPCDLVFQRLSVNSSHTDHPERSFLDIVREMGLPMNEDTRTQQVRVRHDGLRLHAMCIDCRETPDILPILCTLATFADGETVLENIDHIRLKESDRVSAMMQLNRMGGRLRFDGRCLRIQGVDRLVGRDVSSFNDHRVLMSLAVAGTRAEGHTLISYPNAYRISYPEFLQAMNGIGASMECIT